MIWDAKTVEDQEKCGTMKWQQSYRKKDNIDGGNEYGKGQEEIKQICVWKIIDC